MSDRYKKKRVLVIDGDILAYQIATNNEQPTNWGEGLWTLHADEGSCIQQLDAVIDDLGANLSADDYVVALTDKNNFRKDVLPTYKSNRKEKRKPIVLNAMREHIMKKHNGIIWDNLEADDVMGIMATEPALNEERILVSIDKDMRTIPCNLSQDGTTIEQIPEKIANYNFMIQTMMGDKVDGYDGIEGVGIKTAEKLIKKYTNVTLLDLWKIVKGIYKEKGYTQAEALQQARVAHILRHGEYNKKTGKVKTMDDLIKEPPHYANNKIEPIDYIVSNKLDFCEGNVVKYITRWRKKGGIEDLKKCKQYVQFIIDKYEA